jgi:hypothetical protein
MNIKKRILPAVLATLSPGRERGRPGHAVQQRRRLRRQPLGRRLLPPFLARSASGRADGRFSTNPDPVWTELISQFYGYAGTPSNAGGTIYARAARASRRCPVCRRRRAWPSGPVSTQVTEYLTAAQRRGRPQRLYTMFAGANDFFTQFVAFRRTDHAAQLQTNVLLAATQEVQQVGAFRRPARATSWWSAASTAR